MKKSLLRKNHNNNSNDSSFNNTTNSEEILLKDNEFISYASNGLSQEESNNRLIEYGPNSVPLKRQPLLLRAIIVLLSPMSIFMFAVGIISSIIGDWATVVVVSFLMLLNTLFIVIEERQAEKAVDHLRKNLSLDCFVLRSGEWMQVPTETIVPGDLVKLSLGDQVPADCLLQEGRNLEIDESALTGESLPRSRGPGDRVLSGSVVLSGSMTAVVVATGIKSSLGKTVGLMETPKQNTSMQQFIFRIALVMKIASIGLCAILVIVKLATRSGPILVIFQHAMVLLVASLPIAMALMVTTALALGSREMVRVGVITARLYAIEQLAGMDVALCDKTGTLTQNKLKLQDPWLNEGVTEEELLMWAMLCCSQEAPDAIDRVIVSTGAKIAKQTRERFEVLEFTPFAPATKRSTAHVRQMRDGAEFEIVKGAPMTLLRSYAFDAHVTNVVSQTVLALGQRGVRSLGVAVQPKGGPWRYLGVLAMFDPLRPESKETVRDLVAGGVAVKMVTGDGVDIGRETCRQLGMGTQALVREQLHRYTLEEPLRHADVFGATDLFAEVMPEDKFDIVGELQHKGHIVGMTGDGVNDCPALRRADIGIAVQGATDAARVAADIVCTRADTTVLLDAVVVSRMIFERVRNYILFRINCTFTILFWSFLSELALNFGFPALVLIIIAWMNNFVTLAIAYDHIVPFKKPVKWSMRDVVPMACCVGLLSCSEVYCVWSLAQGGYLLFSLYLTPAQIRTALFLTIGVSNQLSVLVLRARSFVFSSTRPGLGLILAIAGTAAACSVCAAFWPFGVGLEPLSRWDVLMCWIVVIVFNFFKDFAKVLLNYAIRHGFGK